MLNHHEIEEIEKEIAKYDYKQAACLEALAIVQHSRGWVSDEHLHDIAEKLEMSPTELDSICTFYNLIFRRPVGKYVIRVCDSISCWIQGYDDLLLKIKNHLKIDLGQTTPDQLFTVVTNPCLGTCDRAPALMINDELHRDLTPDTLEHILNDLKNKETTTSR
jgi:NADH-quinone oxidoreductase subunit E